MEPLVVGTAVESITAVQAGVTVAGQAVEAAVDDAGDKTVSFDTAVEMLRKRARVDSDDEYEDEAHEDAAGLTVIAQL